MTKARALFQTKLKQATFLLLFIATVTWLTLHLLFFVGSSNKSNIIHQFDDLQLTYELRGDISIDGGLVSFQACNGFAIQRLSILYGTLIALRMRKTLVLPRLPLDGTQEISSKYVHGSRGKSERYSNIYDLDMLKMLLQNYNLEVWEVDDLPNVEFTDMQCDQMDLDICIQTLQETTNITDTHINFGCIFPSKIISQAYIFQHEDIVQKILQHLIPSTKYKKYVSQIINKLNTLNEQNQQDFQFNLVHLCADKNWLIQCKKLQNIKDGNLRDNCFNNTENLGQQLVLKQVDNSRPIYVAAQTQNIDGNLLRRIKQNLLLNGYSKVFFREDLDLGEEIERLPREVAVLVDFFVAMRAEQFVGNSVSTISALILLERQFQGKWSSYYNEGNIPLSSYIPLYRVPWIIFSACDHFDIFNKNTLPAIRSAILYGNVDLYLYCGTDTIDKNVQNAANSLQLTFITKNRIQNYIPNSTEIRKTVTLSALVNLQELAQYNYIVVSGPRLYIRKRVQLDNFGLPLPTEIVEYNLPDNSFSWMMMVNSGYIRKGFLLQGAEFMDEVNLKKQVSIQHNEKLVVGLQSVSAQYLPVVVSFGQLKVSDLEVYLVSGFCQLKAENLCRQVMQQGCGFVLEWMVLSSQSNMYPQVLIYCNRMLTIVI